MTSVRVEIASFSGERESCEIEFTQGVPVTLCVRSVRFGELSFTDDNLFAAMSACRRRLEQDGYLLLCNGARRNAYPSQMILEMGGGAENLSAARWEANLSGRFGRHIWCGNHRASLYGSRTTSLL